MCFFCLKKERKRERKENNDKNHNKTRSYSAISQKKKVGRGWLCNFHTKHTHTNTHVCTQTQSVRSGMLVGLCGGGGGGGSSMILEHFDFNEWSGGGGGIRIDGTSHVNQQTRRAIVFRANNET